MKSFMKQVLNSLKFFAVIAIFAGSILLVFLVEKKLVQNFKKDIENIIDISNEFFALNDIAINGKKSELIIINPSVSPADKYVHMENNNAMVKNNGCSLT